MRALSYTDALHTLVCGVHDTGGLDTPAQLRFVLSFTFIWPRNFLKFVPCHTDYSLTYYFVFWLSIVTATFTYIRIHGVEYVSWPRLNRLDDVIYYDGPGFRSHKAPKHPNYTDAANRARLSRPHRIEEVEMGSKKRTE
jgi:hypothetical protein